MNRVSKPFYFGTYLAAIVVSVPLTIGSLMAGEGTIEEEHLPFVAAAGLIRLYAFVLFAILIYKMWKAIPQTVARTTAGKAVGFLFIPVFNLYWWFQAVWGWSQDWNSYAAESEGKVPRMSEGLALSIAIFNAISSIGIIGSFAGVPWLGTVLGAPNWVLVPIFIFKVCTILNNAPAAPQEALAAAPATPQEVGNRSLGVATLVLGILSILLLLPHLWVVCRLLLPCLGVVCGIVAIVLAKKQRKVLREGLALAGLITGIIGIVLWGLAVVLLIVTISLA